jgi:hypothetical protein
VRNAYTEIVSASVRPTNWFKLALLGFAELGTSSVPWRLGPASSDGYRAKDFHDIVAISGYQLCRPLVLSALLRPPLRPSIPVHLVSCNMPPTEPPTPEMDLEMAPRPVRHPSIQLVCISFLYLFLMNPPAAP